MRVAHVKKNVTEDRGGWLVSILRRDPIAPVGFRMDHAGITLDHNFPNVAALTTLVSIYSAWDKPDSARAVYPEGEARSAREYVQPAMRPRQWEKCLPECRFASGTYLC